MTNKLIFILKSFQVHLSNVKTLNFTEGQYVKPSQVKYVSKMRYDRGFVMDLNGKSSSASRRLIGRDQWHTDNRSNPEMDLERELLRLQFELFGDEELRRQGTGQTSKFNSVLDKTQIEFDSEIDLQWVEGNDDITAKRNPDDGRAIRWVASRRTINEALACATSLFLS